MYQTLDKLTPRQRQIYIMIVGYGLMNNELLSNLDKIHSAELGVERVRRNLGLDNTDIISWCKQKIENANDIIRKRKSWYVYVDDCVIIVNAYSFSIITGHKRHL